MSVILPPPPRNEREVVIPPLPSSAQWNKVAASLAADDLGSACCDLARYNERQRRAFSRRQAEAK